VSEAGGRSLGRLRGRLFRLRAARKTGTGRLARFGEGSVIVPPAKILSPHRIEIGAGVLIFENASFSLVEEFRGRRHEPRLRIGDGTLVGHGAWFSCVGEIDIGEHVLIGHNVLIADSFHEYAAVGTPVFHQPMAEPRAVSVGDGAILGPGAAVLSGATVGAGAYVAANALVAGEVPPRSVAAGNPAEVIRRWDPDARDWVDSPDPRWGPLLASLTRGG
jgi:acetyltransferase-like isoleucine patch superfamily enzyme